MDKNKTKEEFHIAGISNEISDYIPCIELEFTEGVIVRYSQRD